MKSFRHFTSVQFLMIMFVYFYASSLNANIKFSNRSSVMEIMQQGRIYFSETDTIKGWSRESIVQDSGGITPFDWDPTWTGENNITYEITPPPDLPQNHGDIVLQTYYYELSEDLLLGPNRHLIVESSEDCLYTYIQGNGFAINLAEGFYNQIQVEAGHTLEIANVVIKNYDENSILLPDTAILRFLDSAIEIMDNRQLTKPLIFAGDVSINGYGYTVSFDPGASINIETGQLTINNLTLYGIQNQNLQCVQSNANMVLQNCNLILTDDYKFRRGGIVFLNSKVSGFNIFSFESALTCSILRTLTLDVGVTFSYSPPVAKNDLIWMNESSQLQMNGCTIKTTTTGLCLYTGTLLIDGENKIYNDGATSISEGISLGNNNLSNNIDVEILPASKLELMSGILVYQNVD